MKAEGRKEFDGVVVVIRAKKNVNDAKERKSESKASSHARTKEGRRKKEVTEQAKRPRPPLRVFPVAGLTDGGGPHSSAQ